jgi:hypothetical protein
MRSDSLRASGNPNTELLSQLRELKEESLYRVKEEGIQNNMGRVYELEAAERLAKMARFSATSDRVGAARNGP